MVAIISPGSHQKKVILPGSHWALKWGKQIMYFRLPTDVAASGYRYGCVGLRIRLYRVTQSAVLADWATWVVWLNHLSSLIEPLE